MSRTYQARPFVQPANMNGWRLHLWAAPILSVLHVAHIMAFLNIRLCLSLIGNAPAAMIFFMFCLPVLCAESAG